MNPAQDAHPTPSNETPSVDGVDNLAPHPDTAAPTGSEVPVSNTDAMKLARAAVEAAHQGIVPIDNSDIEGASPAQKLAA